MTKGEWKSRKLGDFFRIKHGYPFKSKFFSTAGDLIVLTPGNFHAAGGIKLKGDKEKYYTGTFPPVYLLTRGDMLVVMTDLTQNAPILGSPAFVPESDRYLHNQRLGKVVDLSTEIDRRFLFYLFNSSAVRDRLKATATGATVKHTAPERIYSVDVQVPGLSTQRKIASILSAYDDLIENNLRRIQILEEMAQALYREWFVEFRLLGLSSDETVESPAGMIPKGWIALPFQQVLESYRGGDWGTEERTVKNDASVNIVRGTDIDDVRNGSTLRVPARFIPTTSLDKRRLEAGDVVVENSVNAKSRSVGTSLLVTDGVVKRVGENSVHASFCKRFRPTNPQMGVLIHLHLRHLRREKKMLFYQNVATNGIANFQAERFVTSEHLIVPSDRALREEVLDGLWSLCGSTLADQIAVLRESRDLLLPKLISGELDVSDLDIAVMETA